MTDQGRPDRRPTLFWNRLHSTCSGPGNGGGGDNPHNAKEAETRQPVWLVRLHGDLGVCVRGDHLYLGRRRCGLRQAAGGSLMPPPAGWAPFSDGALPCLSSKTRRGSVSGPADNPRHCEPHLFSSRGAPFCLLTCRKSRRGGAPRGPCVSRDARARPSRQMRSPAVTWRQRRGQQDR